MLQVLVNGLIVGSAYAMIGVGFALLFSTVRYFNLAYAMVGVMGAYVVWSLMEGIGLPYVVSLIGGGAVAVLLALGSAVLLFRPMVKRRSSPLVLLVASFGLLTILQNVSALLWGNTVLLISLSDTIVPAYDVAGLLITPNQLVIALVSLLMVLLLELYLYCTTTGMAIRAVGDNPELSRVLGIKAESIVLWVFGLSALLASIGASLIALEIGLKPTYGVFLVIKAVIACIIGGIGSMRGAFVGGLILGVVENVGIFFVGAAWQDTVAFLLLMVFLLFLPSGLFSRRVLVQLS